LKREAGRVLALPKVLACIIPSFAQHSLCDTVRYIRSYAVLGAQCFAIGTQDIEHRRVDWLSEHEQSNDVAAPLVYLCPLTLQARVGSPSRCGWRFHCTVRPKFVQAFKVDVHVDAHAYISIGYQGEGTCEQDCAVVYIYVYICTACAVLCTACAVLCT
jgi:hypothetical protein